MAELNHQYARKGKSTMSRPAKFEDLSDYNQLGPMIATFNHVDLLSLPRKTLIRVLKTIESLDEDVADGLLDKKGSVNSGEDLIYRLRPTEEVREKKLRNAQSEWDRTKERYEDALVDPTTGRTGSSTNGPKQKASPPSSGPTRTSTDYPKGTNHGAIDD